jgi:hypothetical protein
MMWRKQRTLRVMDLSAKWAPFYMGRVESTCAYWVPLVDWTGETVYIEARGVDYIARLPGTEDPVKWYDRFPSLVAARDPEAEEKAPIDMITALDTGIGCQFAKPPTSLRGRTRRTWTTCDPGKIPAREEAATAPQHGCL